jgi:hypothetical protein
MHPPVIIEMPTNKKVQRSVEDNVLPFSENTIAHIIRQTEKSIKSNISDENENIREMTEYIPPSAADTKSKMSLGFLPITLEQTYRQR